MGTALFWDLKVGSGWVYIEVRYSSLIIYGPTWLDLARLHRISISVNCTQRLILAKAGGRISYGTQQASGIRVKPSYDD